MTYNVNASDEGLQRVGKQVAKGALEALVNLAIFLLVLLLASGLALEYFRVGFDGTDDKVRGERSGMTLRTDHATGCQYLETSSGGITPRLDKTGKHIC